MAQEFLQAFLSQDNFIRQNAEAQLNSMNIQTGLQLLAQGLQLPQPELAEMASVLLCRIYLDKDENFCQIPTNLLGELVQLGHQQLSVDQKLSFMKRMCDLVVKVLLRTEQFNDMVQFVLTYPADTLNRKLILMYFIEIMCEFAFDDDLLIKYAEPLNGVFEKYLNEADAQIRVAALRSLTSFLASVENSNTLLKFQGAVPLLLQKVIEAIQLDQAQSVNALQSLSDLIESHPKFLQNSTNDLLCIYSEIMENSKVLSELRRAALHGLQTLCNGNPVQVRKNDIFKQRIIIALMKMLTEVDNTNEEWENDIDDNCLQSQEISAAAQDCLAKISGDLNVKFLLPLFIKMIVPALQSKEWHEQHAGLVAMAMLSEGSSKYFKNDLDSIMQAIIPLTSSSNPRILYDTLTCIALLCQEFHPIIQQKYGQPIMQLIVACQQQQQSLKLQYRGIACLVDFCREIVEEIDISRQVIAPYAQGLLEVLYRLVENNLNQQTLTDKQARISKEALTALSVLAASLKENFASYYDTMMPVMMKIFSSLQGEQYVEVRTLVIECLGFILGSISSTRYSQFQLDASTLLNSFIQYQSTLQSDDQQHPALFSFYSQIATGMKTDFAPYLPQIFTFLEKAVNIDLGLSIGDAVDNSAPEQKNPKVTSIKLDLKFVGLKSLELNTSALEQKIEGAHTLLSLAESTGKAFAPYLQRAANIVMTFVNFKHSRDIRETMAKCLHPMSLACSTALESSQLINTVLPSIITEAQSAIVKRDLEFLNVFLDSISDVTNTFQDPQLQDQQLDQLLHLCAAAMQLVQKEKQEVIANYSSTEQDAEQNEKLEEDLEVVNEITDSVVDITTQMAKLYGPRAEPQLINNLMPAFYNMLTSNQSSQAEVTNSIAFFNGVLPYCNQMIFEKGFEQITPIYANKLINSQDLEIQQNILFGLGEFATKANQTAFKNVLPIASQLAYKMISEPDAKSESKINSYETAIASLGKLGLFQDQNEMLQKFIQCLPLEQTDAAETHLMLLKQVELQNPNLVPLKDQLLQKLQQIKTQDNNNPENEILCDKGRQIINKLLC